MDNYQSTLHSLVIELGKIDESGGRHVSPIYSYIDETTGNIVIEISSLVDFIKERLDSDENESI